MRPSRAGSAYAGKGAGILPTAQQPHQHDHPWADRQCQKPRKVIAVGERGPHVAVRFHPPELPHAVKLAVPKQIMEYADGGH